MQLSSNILHKEYVQNKKSPAQIAKEYNSYPNAVRRELKRLGFTIRGRSEAQSLSLKSGRREHPTKGKKRSDDTKQKISDGQYEAWQNLSPKEYKIRVQNGKNAWNNLTEAQKQSIRLLAARAIKDASIHGSKLEHIIFAAIQDLGYRVEFHKQDLLVNEKLHIDLFVPKLGLAIEVDGPAHFLPIWGIKSLQKHIKADNEKNGLIISKGFKMLRIKCLKTRLSKKRERQVVEEIQTLIRKFVNCKNKSDLLEYEI